MADSSGVDGEDGVEAGRAGQKREKRSWRVQCEIIRYQRVPWELPGSRLLVPHLWQWEQLCVSSPCKEGPIRKIRRARVDLTQRQVGPCMTLS